jgi:MinD-like ATPase involved in chromosome partitioning or flagellar assembly
LSRVISIHGVDSKVGTTMISQSLAELIAREMKEIKVLLMAFNGKGGTGYVSMAGETMDNLRVALDSQVHSVNELLKGCRVMNNLYILNSSFGIGKERRYHPETVTPILNRLKDSIDLIITDCGGELDDGLAVGALKGADETYCVLTQQEFGLERYDRLKGWYERLEIHFNNFVVNKYRSDDRYGLKDIARRIDAEEDKVFKISETNYDRLAEIERRTFLNYKNGRYTEEIKCIANCILKGAGYLPIEGKRKAFWRTFT